MTTGKRFTPPVNSRHVLKSALSPNPFKYTGVAANGNLALLSELPFALGRWEGLAMDCDVLAPTLQLPSLETLLPTVLRVGFFLLWCILVSGTILVLLVTWISSHFVRISNHPPTSNLSGPPVSDASNIGLDWLKVCQYVSGVHDICLVDVPWFGYW